MSENIAKVPSRRGVEIITDRGLPVVFTAGITGQRRCYVCVDNLGTLACSRREVTETLGEWRDQFNRCRLVLRDDEIHDVAGTALGCAANGLRKRTMLTEARFWKVRQGITGVLKRGRVSGRALEVVIGHATFCGLANRLSSSIFHTVCRFIHAQYYASCPNWGRVAEELYAFVGVVWLLQLIGP